MNKMIFGGASTFSKMHCNYPENFPETAPDTETVFDTVSGLGSRLIDMEDEGGMLSLPCRKESVLSEALKNHFPFIEMVRYGCNGADATEGAIRYARNYTGKRWVASVGYHSCQSAFTANTPPALGCVPGMVKQFSDFEALIKYISSENVNDVAAVIMEPVMLDMDVREKLTEIRSITNKKGIALIFDEIITGFRVPKRSISNWYEITPDLILLGKALGGGYPLSVIGGKKEIMNVPVFHSYTFAGLPHSLRNAIDICKISDEEIQKFWDMADAFMKNFNDESKEIKLIGYATRGVWSGPEELKFTFWQEMYKRGIFLGPAFFPRMEWTIYDYSLLLRESIKTINEIESNGIKLEGRMPSPIFRRNS